MSTQRTRLQTWRVRIILTSVALLAAVAGLSTYWRDAATPLLADPQDVPSVVRSEPAPEWAEAVDRARRAMRAGLVDQNLPGLSVAVGVGGELVWAEGFGWSDLKQRQPVTPETRFRIGAASTVLTSAAVGVLRDKEQLKLDESIQTYVPQLSQSQSQSRTQSQTQLQTQWPVTLRHLMGHVGGLPTDDGRDAPLFRQRCERPVEALPHVAHGALLFEPGAQYRHSNYGWILVSAAVEAAADQPFLTFMRKQIFQPLGMNDTGAESATEENPEHIGEPGEDAPPITFIRQVILEPLGIVGPKPTPAGTHQTIATVYEPGSGVNFAFRSAVHAMRPRNLSCYAGAMAFFSTPSDLVRFGLAIDRGKLLQPATVQLLQTSQRLTSGQETGAGLGWDLRNVTLAGEPAQAVGYDGASSGEKAVSLMTFRERGIVVAIVSNMTSADSSALALTVAEAFAQHTPQSRIQQKPRAQRF